MAIRLSNVSCRAVIFSSHFTTPTSIAFMLATASCSLSVDASRSQCHTDDDCVSGPSALAAGTCVEGLCDVRAEWTCSGAPRAVSSTSPAGSVEVVLPLVDLLARDPEGGLEARLCRKLDVSCDAPTQTMTMETSGEFVLPLDDGFEGYLSIRGADLVPTLYFLSPPLASGERLPALTLMSRELMEALAVEMKVELLPDRGLSLFTIQDCNGAYASGVTFDAQPVDDATTPFYDVDGIPTAAATLTGRTGSGGFINAPAGPLSVGARLNGSDAFVASASVLIRPGFVSYGRLLTGAAPADPLMPAL